MHLKTALLLAASALYMTASQAATSTSYPARCAVWYSSGQLAHANTPCEVSAGMDGSTLRYLVTMPAGQPYEIRHSDWGCLINGEDRCELRPALRPGAVRFLRIDGGAIEFDAPSPGSF